MEQYSTAFLLGLLGSLHCAGMCGPLALALASSGGGGARFVLGRLAYNLGRLVTYGVLGLVFGLVGQSLALAGLQRWVSLGLGLALLAGLGASQKLATALPAHRLGDWLKAGMGFWLRQRSLPSLGVLGLLNGLLPCGLVYVACAGATTTGHVLTGAAYMAVFGLGTVPVMLAIGLSGQLMPPALRLRLLKAVPFGVAILGVLLILRGLALGIPYVSPDLAAEGGPACCPGHSAGTPSPGRAAPADPGRTFDSAVGRE